MLQGDLIHPIRCPRRTYARAPERDPVSTPNIAKTASVQDAAYADALRVGILSRPQAARYLQVTPRWFERGSGAVIPHARIGRDIRYRLSDLDAYLDSRMEEPAPANPRIAHFLRKRGQA